MSSGEFDFPTDMDDVPRFSEDGPTDMPVGVTGAWTEARGLSDAGESFPSELVQGVRVPACN